MRPATSVVPPYTSRVVDSLFVGETENVGNPKTDAEKAYGRSLPEPEIPDFPIRAYEFYDYRHELDNDTFVNYQDNATRKTGAISYLLFTSFGMSSNNTVERAKFINAKPVYFPPMEYKWSNDDYGSGSYRTSVFHDKDGSVGGVPDSFIVINGGIALDEACEVKPTWNAAVCKGDVGRMTIGAAGGGRWWRSWRRSWRCPVVAGGSWRAWRAGAGALARSLVRLQVAVVLVPLPPAARRSRPCCWCKDWSHRRACAAGSRSQPQRQGFPRHRDNQRTSGHRVQGNHRKAVPVPQRVGTGCRFVGDVRAAGIHHRSLGYGSRTAWMHCARPVPPRTTKATVRFGSSLSPAVTSLAAALTAALVAEPASRSAGMLPLLLLLLDRQVAPSV